VCFLLRRIVIETRFQKRVIRPADIPEFAALNEVRYSVTPQGGAVAEPANTRTLDYIGFSLMASFRMFRTPMSFDRSTTNWQNLVQAVRIRDRITHPKTLADVTISDAEIKIIDEFGRWFAAHLRLLSNNSLLGKIRREAGIAKRSKKTRKLTFDVPHFNRKA
jgi:hypothetical protein